MKITVKLRTAALKWQLSELKWRTFILFYSEDADRAQENYKISSSPGEYQIQNNYDIATYMQFFD